MKFISIKKGFTLLEMLIAISIVFLISFFSFSSFSAFNKKQILDQTAEQIVSMLEEAKLSTVFYKDASQYSIHFEENEAVLFKGATYLSSDPENKAFIFNPVVHISGINLFAGSSDVVFKKLTGKTDQTGNIILSLVSDPTKFKTITIDETGIFSKN